MIDQFITNGKVQKIPLLYDELVYDHFKDFEDYETSLKKMNKKYGFSLSVFRKKELASSNPFPVEGVF